MTFSLHPGILSLLAVALFLATQLWLKWPLPLTFIAVAAATALLGGYGLPFRHLVEGGFGFINLILGLFSGAFFGHMMRRSGASEITAEGIVRLAGGRALPVLVMVGAPIFVVGMFVGIAGIAVLSAGVFAVPALKRIGFDDATTAAFIAVIATAGMIAPPMNVPAMLIADGTNMPWTNVSGALLALSLPMAISAVLWFGLRQPSPGPSTLALPGRSAPGGTLRGLAPLAVIVAAWIGVRLLGNRIPDPSSPLILLVGGFVALPWLPRHEFRKVVWSTFTGTPLLLAAALVSIGILVQIMTLTGVRGWIVIGTMSLQPPWNYPSLLLGMPLVGGALTSMVTSDVIGVPAAFSFIKQDMILNVAALSAIAALAEFVAPTSIAAALSCYVVNGGSVWKVFTRAWLPLAVLALCAILMLVFAPRLTGILT
ncbi:MAG: TRAP transporter large permease subunit [Microvirga sp.]